MNSDAFKNPLGPDQRWRIGSRDSCDIVIEHELVSPEHCEIRLVGHQLQILDLASEHGTWVEGRAIRDLQNIRRGNQIFLGKAVELLWPIELQNFESVISVGRDQSNDVVLDKPNISLRHARIIDDGMTLRVEDIGSTNGVFLNRPDNRIEKCQVQPDDALYLGSTRIRVERILEFATLTSAIDSDALAERMQKQLGTTPEYTDEELEQQQRRSARESFAMLSANALASIAR